MNKEFKDSIIEMNKLYGLPINDKPTDLGVDRLKNFKKILTEEIQEMDEIIKKYENIKNSEMSEEEKLEILTAISDVFGDIVVYVRSEALKYGIDLEEVLKIIMQSNFSKMGADGKPIYDERGKVTKGPNYWKPEPKIKDMLKSKLELK